MKVDFGRRTLLAAAASGCVLSSCTTLYVRDFAVDPVQGISPQEQQQVFEAFRDFLASKGFQAVVRRRTLSRPRKLCYRWTRRRVVPTVSARLQGHSGVVL